MGDKGGRGVLVELNTISRQAPCTFLLLPAHKCMPSVTIIVKCRQLFDKTIHFMVLSVACTPPPKRGS